MQFLRHTFFGRVMELGALEVCFPVLGAAHPGFNPKAQSKKQSSRTIGVLVFLAMKSLLPQLRV